MTIAEIICIVLLSVFIFVFVIDMACGYFESKRQFELEAKIDKIVSYIEAEESDNTFLN